jgi:transposase
VDRGRAGFRFEHLRAIGYETAEQLGVEPAQYFVRVTKRETRACKTCEEQGVRCAPLPPRIIEKGLASDRVVIDTVVSKYLDHLPLYRQSAILERETGLEISRATLDGWVMRVGELLRPISEAMAEELLSGNYIQADETPVGVQSDRARGKNHLAYLWQYSRPGGSRWCSTSESVGNGPVRNGSWLTLRAYCRVTATRPTIMWVVPRWCMRRAGHMPGESSFKRWKSIQRTSKLTALSRRWINSLKSIKRHVSRD